MNREPMTSCTLIRYSCTHIGAVHVDMCIGTRDIDSENSWSPMCARLAIIVLALSLWTPDGGPCISIPTVYLLRRKKQKYNIYPVSILRRKRRWKVSNVISFERRDETHQPRHALSLSHLLPHLHYTFYLIFIHIRIFKENTNYILYIYLIVPSSSWNYLSV